MRDRGRWREAVDTNDRQRAPEGRRRSDTGTMLDRGADAPVQRVMVYRLGSVGDFVVALPALHLLRRRFPTAKIQLLSNHPMDDRAAPPSSLLDGSGLINSFIFYRPHARSVRELCRISRQVRAFDPDLFVYLAESRGAVAVYRDYLFFRWLCGARKIIGVPFTRDLRNWRAPAEHGGLWERKAVRLGRCLAPLGPILAESRESWDLLLSASEIAEADRIVDEFLARRPDVTMIVGLSMGTKQAIKDWGAANWRKVLDDLQNRHWGLVLIGAASEREASDQVASSWPGPVLNLCGRTSPRLSAAVMRRFRVMLCHDSAPMHLADAVGTRCVAVFSTLGVPGEMYPMGPGHELLYPPPGTNSIQAIQPAEVVAAAKRILEAK